MSKEMDRILSKGVVAGLLAHAEKASANAPRPWPLTVFTGIGAWFAAIPFAVALFVLGGSAHTSSLAVLGAAVMCGAIVVLKTKPTLFVEQLALAGMAASALMLYFYIDEKANAAIAALSICATLTAAACFLPQTWLRVLLGAAIGVMGNTALRGFNPLELADESSKLYAVLTLSIFWCLLAVLPSRSSLSTQSRMGIEAVSLGMSATIVCSPFWVNDSFFFLRLDDWLERWADNLPAMIFAQAAVSVTVTLASGIFLAWKWAPLRSFWFVVVTLVIATFAWLVPSLCVLVLIGSVALVSGRKSIAVLCAVMLVWWMGCCYFSLQWLLIDKACLLAVSGAILALTTVFLFPGEPIDFAAPMTLPQRVKGAFIIPSWAHGAAFFGSAILALGIANVSIMHKEAVAAAGTTVFVELAPIDPRSLVQGDYMSLSFKTGPLAETGSSDVPRSLVGMRDNRGVWSVERADDGTPLEPGELKINLGGTAAHPIFVTDAWFFKEGEARRWQTARFGELRVKPDGSAVLVGMRGKNLEEL